MRQFIALIAAVWLAAAAGDGRAQQVQRIAAIVNDDIVSVYDLEARLRMVVVSAGLEPSRELHQRLAPQVLRGLIDERLRLQEAKRRSVSVTKRDLDRAVATLEQQNRMPPGKFDEELARQGIPKDTVMDQLRAEIAWAKLVRQRIAPRISVGDDEVQETLNRMKAQQGQTEYRLAEIVLNFDKPENAPEVRRTAQRLMDQMRRGAQFSAVARQFSQSATASVGGDVGWIAESALSDELRRVVPKMKEGELAGPITTIDSVEILLLRDKRRLMAADPDDARIELRRILLPLPQNPAPAGVETQIALAHTLGETVSGCDDMASAAKEMGSPAPPDLGTIRVGDLAAELRALVRDLPVGKVSAPLRTPDGISVFMVCKRTDPPSGLPAPAEVERRLRLERIENAARRYMRDLRYAAVVDVRV